MKCKSYERGECDKYSSNGNIPKMESMPNIPQIFGTLATVAGGVKRDEEGREGKHSLENV